MKLCNWIPWTFVSSVAFFILGFSIACLVKTRIFSLPYVRDKPSFWYECNGFFSSLRSAWSVVCPHLTEFDCKTTSVWPFIMHSISVLDQWWWPVLCQILVFWVCKAHYSFRTTFIYYYLFFQLLHWGDFEIDDGTMLSGVQNKNISIYLYFCSTFGDLVQCWVSECMQSTAPNATYRSVVLWFDSCN